MKSISHANAPPPFWLVKRAQNAAGAALTGGFFALNSVLLARPGGRVRISFEARNLVLRFYLEETRNARRLETSCLRNNIVEAFIDTKHDHESYYHVLLNMLGECSMERVLRGNKARTWHCAVKTALSLAGDVWTAYMKIPLAGLGVKTVMPGGLWGLNFVRTRFLKFGDFHYSSAAPGLPCFRCPGLFGHLVIDRPFCTVEDFSTGRPSAGKELETGVSLTCRTERVKTLKVNARVVFPSGTTRRRSEKARVSPGESRRFVFSFGAAEGGRHDFYLTAGEAGSSRVLYRERRAIMEQSPVKIIPERYFYDEREKPALAEARIGVESSALKRCTVRMRIVQANVRKPVWESPLAPVKSAVWRQKIMLSRPLPPGKYFLEAELIGRQTWKILGLDRRSFYKLGRGGNFAVLRGIEISRKFGMCDGLVIGEGRRPVRALCHPDWFLGATARQIMRFRRFDAMEVYNFGGSTVWTEKWDYLLSHGRKVWALAVDDSHNVHTDSGRAWIAARLKRLDSRSVLDAVRAGNFYVSNGPVLKNIAYDRRDNTLHVSLPEGSAECRINFIGFNGCNLQSHKGVKAVYRVTGNERYVRVEVIDPDGKRAWSQPFFTARGRVHDPYRVPGAWHKGNLHTHTTCSGDGVTDPVEVMEWYRAHGYSFVAITDHNVRTK